MKLKLNYKKLIINKMRKYDYLEFYPKNHIIANGTIEIIDAAILRGKEISVSIMKINKTYFTASGDIYCDCSIYGDEECRQGFIDDIELEKYYYEELTPTTVLVSLALEYNNLQYQTSSSVDFANIEKVSDIKNSSSDFNKFLECKIEDLLSSIPCVPIKF